MEEEKKLPLAETATSAGERKSDRRCPPAPKAAPWLVFPYGNHGKNQAFYNLCEPNNKTYQRKFIPEISRKLYWQKPCQHEWLVILCNNDDEDEFGNCFLWNPLTFETIELPTMLHWINDESTHYLKDCVLSSPLTNPNSMVFFLFAENDSTSAKLVFCRPRKDKEWRTKEFFVGECLAQKLVCLQGNKLYIMCYYQKHQEIEIDNWSNCIDDGNDENLSIRPFHVIKEIRDPLIVSTGIYSRKYYVGSCDELFQILIYSHPKYHDKEVLAFQVLRMNFSLMAWEEVNDIGDHVFFLGESTISCCSASELGLTRGCVFFTMPHDKSLYKLDLVDATISVDLPCPNLPTPWFSPDWVMIPTNVRSDGQRKPNDTIYNNEKEEDIIIRAEEIKTITKSDDKEEEVVHKNNERELKESSGTWDILTVDILELIASYLHPVDYSHFRQVCKGNRSAVPAVSWTTSRVEITQTTYLSPWLVSYQKNDASYKFLNPMHNNEEYFMNLHDLLVDAEIRFSKNGWLLMCKGERTVFFFNPLTREMIQLPEIPEYLKYCFSGISFSSLPTSADCVVFAIAEVAPYICICLISRTDDSWRSGLVEYTNLPLKKNCMEYIPCYNSPVFYNGVFYCLDYNGALGAFDSNDCTWKFLEYPQRPCNSINRSFLVECGGKLFSVFLGRLGKWVRIFRLDFSKMVWVRVESLGQHTLFISNTSCLSAVTPSSHMKNKIYFPRLHGEEIIFYSLDTGRFHSLDCRHSAQDFYNTKEQLYCSWIEPNWSRAKDQELHWLL